MPDRQLSFDRYQADRYQPLHDENVFELALRMTGMNGTQLAEDLRVQRIIDRDASSVRRWIRCESVAPDYVWDRLEEIAEYVYGPVVLGKEQPAIRMPPAARRLRYAIYHRELERHLAMEMAYEQQEYFDPETDSGPSPAEMWVIGRQIFLESQRRNSDIWSLEAD